MSNDPFHYAKEELESRVGEATNDFQSWRSLLRSSNTSTSREFRAKNDELKSTLETLLVKCNSLDRAVNKIFTNRAKFGHVSDEELEARRNFVDASKNRVLDMRAQMNSAKTKAKLNADAKAELLAKPTDPLTSALESENDDGAGSSSARQMFLRREQDEHLDSISHTLSGLQSVGVTIHGEIESQNALLDELDEDVNFTMSRMDAVMGRLDKLLQTKDSCQRNLIIALLLVAFFLLVLVSVT